MGIANSDEILFSCQLQLNLKKNCLTSDMAKINCIQNYILIDSPV